MKIKLTLSAEPEVIKEAKRLAAENKTSVSAMFGRMIRTMARQGKGGGVRLGPISRKASGFLTLPKGKKHRDVLTEALMEKYGIDP